MRVVIFGETDNIGEAITKAVSKYWKVVVLTQQEMPSKGNIHYEMGDVLSFVDIDKCLMPDDEVIIVLGLNSRQSMMSLAIKNIIGAMKANECRRVICLSSQGAGNSWDHMPEEFKKIVMNTSALKSAFADLSLQETMLGTSGLDWTIVRPTEIVDDEETKTFAVNDLPENPTYKISKFDVATFIVKELVAKKYICQTVVITN